MHNNGTVFPRASVLELEVHDIHALIRTYTYIYIGIQFKPTDTRTLTTNSDEHSHTHKRQRYTQLRDSCANYRTHREPSSMLTCVYINALVYTQEH